MSLNKKKSAVLFFLGCGLGATAWLAIYLFQFKLLFLPSAVTFGEKPPSTEEVFFQTADGVKLNGWYFPTKDDASLTILYFHGNADNITSSHPYAEWFLDHDIGLFVFDYRGYGKSDVKLARSETELFADSEAAYNYLVQQKGIAPDRIVLWGRSLGGATATHVASRFPAAGLVLQSAFASALEMAQKKYPFLPVKLITRFPLRSDEKIREVKSPVLILHALDDTVIPFAHAEKMYERARFPKEFIKIEGGHHGALRQILMEHEAEFTAFFDSL